MYSVPDKSKRRPPPQHEMATYQDPNTIERHKAPTGDLYAMPEKKKPVYSQVNKDYNNTIVAIVPIFSEPVLKFVSPHSFC